MAILSFFDSKECEWSDMVVLMGGAPITKIKGLKYKASKDKQLLHAAGDEPMSIQSGNRSYEGSITVYKGALDDLNRAAKLAGGMDILDIQFDVVVTYKPHGARKMQSDLLKGVEIKAFEKGMDQGAKFMEVELPILFLKLMPN
jgi:hypothetical protein